MTPFLWFKTSAGATVHRKMRRLADRTRIEAAQARSIAGAFAVGFFWASRLWEVALKNAPGTGVLEGTHTPAELEFELGWTGEPGELIEALRAAGLLAQDRLAVHEWEQHQAEVAKLCRLGKAQEERPTRAPENRDQPPSGSFLAFWKLIGPLQHSRKDTYNTWIRIGLDHPDAEDARARLFRALRAQMRDDRWRRKNEKTTSRSYLNKRLWEDWEPPHVEDRAPAVPVVTLPQRNDEKDLRAEFVERFGDRPWPGYDVALAEVMAAAAKGRN